MKNSEIQLRWVYEFLWLLMSVIIVVFFTWKIYPNIHRGFFLYISGTMFFAINFLRWILFPSYSPLMHSFWFKMIMAFLNIPFFILIVRYFLSILEVFDSFNFSYGLNPGNLIHNDVSLDFIMYVRTLTIASVTSCIFTLILFEFRSIQLVFKWRQVPASFLK